MTVMVVQQIQGTPDYNFIYNNSVVAVALLQCEEYYLYFYDGGYDEKTVMLCYESLKTLNECLQSKLKQENI